MTVTLELQPDNTWRVIDHNCSAPVGGPPQLTGADVRDAAQRLVPRPGIGIAPPGGQTLINEQTVLWINTPPDRSLGTIQLLGQPVTLDIHLDHITWNFGDHTTDTTTTPGKPYTPTDPCTTTTCPTYYGHTYRTPTTVQLSATTTWTGRYRIATGPWQPIPGTVTTAPATTTLRIREARSVLVPNH